MAMEPPPSQTPPLCGICAQQCSIYTCPRCAIRTCSLPCSQSHKALQSCSGERDKAAYVPMNKYGWGSMANDYVYLEEVGRKTAEWGRDIVKGGFLASVAAVQRGRGRGRGRGARNAARSGGRGKREVLKMQLEARDIDMETLPPGMDKRRHNQSTWDVKTKFILLTLELVFHAPRDLRAPKGFAGPPFNLLTHRNKLDCTVLDTIRRHIGERSKQDAIPAWVKNLVPSAEDDQSTPLLCLMAQHSTSPSHPVAKAYHKFDATQSLSTVLRHKSFVEYPTIDVWEAGEFTGALIETDGTFVKGEDDLPLAKRRRLDTVGGQKIIKSLLGGYKSEEEEKDEGNVLNTLGAYGTEDELDSEGFEEDPDKEAGDVEEPSLEDLHNILDAVGQNPADLTEDQMPWPEGGDEEEVDWGDSAEDDAEELVLALKQHRAPHRSE